MDVEGMDRYIVEALEVGERDYTVSELVTDLKNEALLATILGTAALVIAVSVSWAKFGGRGIRLDAEGNPPMTLLRQWLYDILYGKKPSEWVEIVEEARVSGGLGNGVFTVS